MVFIACTVFTHTFRSYLEAFRARKKLVLTRPQICAKKVCVSVQIKQLSNLLLACLRYTTVGNTTRVCGMCSAIHLFELSAMSVTNVRHTAN